MLTISQVGEHRRALDNSGLRYLIAMRSFFLSQSHQRALACEGIQRQHGHRLRYREIVWAFHSESQEILLQDSIDACTSKITWLTARALGTFLWLRSRESLVGFASFSKGPYGLTRRLISVGWTYGGSCSEHLHCWR